MAQWTLDYNADATGLDFPFDRPYLDFYNRCLITLRAIDAFLRIPPNDPKVVSAAKRLHRILAVVSSEVPFFQAVRRLRRRAKLFDKLRGKLRLASKLPENDSEDDLNIMRENFDEWIDSIRKRLRRQNSVGFCKPLISHSKKIHFLHNCIKISFQK